MNEKPEQTTFHEETYNGPHGQVDPGQAVGVTELLEHLEAMGRDAAAIGEINASAARTAAEFITQLMRDGLSMDEFDIRNAEVYTV